MTETRRVLTDLSTSFHQSGVDAFIAKMMSFGFEESYAKELADGGFDTPSGAMVDKGMKGATFAKALGLWRKEKSSQFPQAMVLYEVVARLCPDQITIVRRDTPEGRVHINLQAPYATNGASVSIAHVVLGEETESRSGTAMAVERIFRERLGAMEGAKVMRTLEEVGCVLPSPEMATRIAMLLKDKGKPITIYGAFCPDYAYEEIEGPIPYRYTFNDVGCGIGLVARRLVGLVGGFHSLCKTLLVPHRFVLEIADFEADDEGTLARVGLSRCEFLQRCQLSAEAVRLAVSELSGEIEVSVGMIKEASECLFDTHVSHASVPNIPTVHVDDLVDQYGPFYDRWHGRSLDRREIAAIILGQGGQYAGLASLTHKRFGDNVLQLAADRPEMYAVFGGVVPFVCAHRSY